jgi:hypothetical protein
VSAAGGVQFAESHRQIGRATEGLVQRQTPLGQPVCEPSGRMRPLGEIVIAT